MICNVFLMISAWFLCDKPFRFERIARTWLTVLLYSLACGAVHYVEKRDAAVLVKYLFPVSNAVVWYASAYIAVLMLSPFLNLILHKAGMRGRAVTVCILFAAVSVLPSFYPKSYLQFTNTGWFALLYLVTGLIKQGRLTLKRSHACFLFFAGWIMAIGFYNWYDYAVLHHALAWIFEQLGFYKNMYFAMLSSLPCFLSAAGLFMLFLNRGGKTGISRFHAWGGGKTGMCIAGCLYSLIHSRNKWKIILDRAASPKGASERCGLLSICTAGDWCRSSVRKCAGVFLPEICAE